MIRHTTILALSTDRLRFVSCLCVPPGLSGTPGTQRKLNCQETGPGGSYAAIPT